MCTPSMTTGEAEPKKYSWTEEHWRAHGSLGMPKALRVVLLVSSASCQAWFVLEESNQNSLSSAPGVHAKPGSLAPFFAA